MVRGKQRSARKKWLEKQEEEAERQQEKGRALYICTCESNSWEKKYRYRVLAIGLSDLYQFSSVPIPIHLSKVLHQVDSLEGNDVLGPMSFGVIGSRIVLLGDEDIKTTYILDTNEPKPTFISSSSSSTNDDSIWMIPDIGPYRCRPWLPEINGKLYALYDDSFGDPAFDELVPEDSEYEPYWNPLPRLPIMPHALDLSTCAVLGTQIFVTIPMEKWKQQVKIFCFDVAHPEGQWTQHIVPCNSDPVCPFPGLFNKVLVLDLEDKEKDKEKLMFAFDFDHNLIRVFSMKLSNEGKPESIEQVDTIELPPAILASSYSCAHLGGRKVCFILLSSFHIQLFTFKFFYSPFSVKHLGSLLFDFERKMGNRLSWCRFGGCFVLNSIAPCQHTS